MSLYEDKDYSSQGARPVELYLFMNGATPYAYTDANDDEEHGGLTYKANGIYRDDITQNNESAQQRLKVSVPRDSELAKLYINIVPPRTVWLTIFRRHEGDGDGETITYYTGRVRQVSWGASASAVLDCEPIEAAMKRMGLRRTYGTGCDNFLYDARCTVQEVDYEVVTTVEGASGLTITSAAFGAHPDTWFQRGFVRRVADGDVRSITAHTGDRVTMRRQFPSLVLGEAIKVYPGCDHTLKGANGCVPKFNNGINAALFHRVPKRNVLKTGLG